MTKVNDAPRASSAEVHILFNGYARGPEPATPMVSRVASTISFVRDGAALVIIDPGMAPDQQAILEPLAALDVLPASITDVIFSHHHPDHTSMQPCSQMPVSTIFGLSTGVIPGRISQQRDMSCRLLSD